MSLKATCTRCRSANLAMHLSLAVCLKNHRREHLHKGHSLKAMKPIKCWLAQHFCSLQNMKSLCCLNKPGRQMEAARIIWASVFLFPYFSLFLCIYILYMYTCGYMYTCIYMYVLWTLSLAFGLFARKGVVKKYGPGAVKIMARTCWALCDIKLSFCFRSMGSEMYCWLTGLKPQLCSCPGAPNSPKYVIFTLGTKVSIICIFGAEMETTEVAPSRQVRQDGSVLAIQGVP